MSWFDRAWQWFTQRLEARRERMHRVYALEVERRERWLDGLEAVITAFEIAREEAFRQLNLSPTDMRHAEAVLIEAIGKRPCRLEPALERDALQ
jgi:hypothetical protein